MEDERVGGVSIRGKLPIPSLTSHLVPQNWLGGLSPNIISVGLRPLLLIFLGYFKAPCTQAQVRQFSGLLLFPCDFPYSFIAFKTSSGLRPYSGQVSYLLTPQHILNVSFMAGINAGTGIWL